MSTKAETWTEWVKVIQKVEEMCEMFKPEAEKRENKTFTEFIPLDFRMMRLWWGRNCENKSKPEDVEREKAEFSVGFPPQVRDYWLSGGTRFEIKVYVGQDLCLFLSVYKGIFRSPADTELQCQESLPDPELQGLESLSDPEHIAGAPCSTCWPFPTPPDRRFWSELTLQRTALLPLPSLIIN